MNRFIKSRIGEVSRSGRGGIGYLCAGLLMALFFTGLQPENALAQLTQVTDSTVGTSFNSSINSDGTRIAFQSDADLTGGNSDGNFEIFLYDTTTDTLTQVTNSTVRDNLVPSINSDGTRIVFASDADLTGGNSDGNFEIFLYDTTTDTLTQVTDSTVGTSFNPSINSDGTRIAFHSFADLTGDNPDGNFEIFLYDTTTDTLTQATDSTAGDSVFPSANSDGTRITFHSLADLTGDNSDGNVEVFLYDTTTGTFTQVTDSTVGNSGEPSINSGGTRIAFISTADLTGGNSDGNFEVFLYDTTTGILTQVTDSTVENSFNPSINSDGTRITFHSSADLTGGNSDGNVEVFLYDTTTGTLTQVTNSTVGNSGEPSINSDGAHIAFHSFADLTGGNSDGTTEVFLQSGSGATTCDGLIATKVGTSGNNVIDGTSGADVIHGMGGSDTIRGFGGNDRICGGDGNDNLIGGGGRDRLLGGKGKDTLSGGDANDTLNGGPGDDKMNGGGGTDDKCSGGTHISGDTVLGGCETITGVP